MNALSDAAVARLKVVVGQPDASSDRYELLEAIGQGGMGTVYRALDRDLDREVAMKVPNAAGEETLERRLRQEARVLASLEHPGIVPIHDAGRLADGRLFYVMKRVRGRTLREYLRTDVDVGARLRIFERICEPVAFAHARGFIHRDLKPDNVMLGAFGEVLVLDWGVAKLLGGPEAAAGAYPAAPGGTRPGTIVGTQGFMSPEQARGSGEDVDQRADVYGLGGILFLLLTGDDPAADPAAVLTARGAGPRPLRSVCARALAADPAARYPTVEALADDIARYRAGEAVLAHRETVLERIGRFGRTYRTAILLVLAYILMRAAVAFLTGF